MFWMLRMQLKPHKPILMVLRDWQLLFLRWKALRLHATKPSKLRLTLRQK